MRRNQHDCRGPPDERPDPGEGTTQHADVPEKGLPPPWTTTRAPPRTPRRTSPRSRRTPLTPSKSSGKRPAARRAASRPDRDDRPVGDDARNDVELPEKMSEGRPSAEASERALVRKPKIGDTMPVPSTPPPGRARTDENEPGNGNGNKRRRRGGKGKGKGGGAGAGDGDEARPARSSPKRRGPPAADAMATASPVLARSSGAAEARAAIAAQRPTTRCSSSARDASATASPSVATSCVSRSDRGWRRSLCSKGGT